MPERVKGRVKGRVKQRPEQVLQIQVAAFLNVALPEESLWWHTPNQVGNRSYAEAGILKAMGVKAGIPDILILYRARLYAIELKAGSNSSTPAQGAIQATMAELGARVAPDAGSVEQVERALRAWEIPLHASVLGLATSRWTPPGAVGTVGAAKAPPGEGLSLEAYRRSQG